MIKKRYLCNISYDGSSYKGLVKQPNKITILETMEKAFVNSFGEDICIMPAGRTDSGVHAKGQMIEFNSFIPKDKIVRWWNNSLPNSIHVNSCTEIKSDFFSRKVLSHWEKIYISHIYKGI